MLNDQTTQSSDYTKRLSKHQDHLYALFYDLYGDRPGFGSAFQDLLNLLNGSYSERATHLKERDQKRINDSNWLLSEKWVGMALYVDRFSKDLKHLTDRLGYLEELGVNLIHLMPIMESPKGENDGGYAVSNYLKVDPKYGSNEDLENLIQELQNREMGIMVDLVINHTSDQHEWALKAMRGDTKYQELYLMYDNPVIPEKFEESLPEIFPETSPGNFIYEPNIKKHIFSTFNSYQWDLNYKNPQVFIEMLNNLLSLFNMGVDIVRLDAPAFIWKQMGTTCQNLDEVHWILQLFKTCTMIVAPGTALLSEAIVAPKEILKYFGGAQEECDLAYNALFMALLWDAVSTQNNKLLVTSFNNLPSKPPGTTWLNYVRCHDDIGLGYDDEHIFKAGYTPFDHRQFLLQFLTGKYPGSFATGDLYMYNPKTKDARISGALASLAGLESALQDQDEYAVFLAIHRIILLHSMVLSLGGIPMLYYGDELGTINDYSYLEDRTKKSDNRWMHRPKIDWEKAAKYQVPGTVEERIFSKLQKLIQIRKQSPEFADHNSFTLIELNDPQLFAFLRFNKQLHALIIGNLAAKPKVINKSDLNFLKPYFPNGFYNKLNDLPLFSTEDHIHLAPFGFLWLGKYPLSENNLTKDRT